METRQAPSFLQTACDASFKPTVSMYTDEANNCVMCQAIHYFWDQCVTMEVKFYRKAFC